MSYTLNILQHSLSIPNIQHTKNHNQKNAYKQVFKIACSYWLRTEDDVEKEKVNFKFLPNKM